MNKIILHLVLATTIITTVNAEKTTSTIPDLLKKRYNTIAKDISQHKIKYASEAIIIAAALYDYYANNADVMRNAAAIAEKYAKIGFDKTKTSAQKLAELVKEKPVLAMSAISGAALITGSGIYLHRENNARKIRENNARKVIAADNARKIREAAKYRKIREEEEYAKIREIRRLERVREEKNSRPWFA